MKNEYKVTKELIKSWAREYHLIGAANVVSFVMLCISCGLGVLAVVMSVMGIGGWLTSYFGVLLIFLAIYKLFFARFVIWNKRYKMWSTAYGVAEWIRSHEFAEDEIVLTDHNSVVRMRYENIVEIKEKGNTVLIVFKGNSAMRIYKDTFTEGSWEECRALLASKMITK